MSYTLQTLKKKCKPLSRPSSSPPHKVTLWHSEHSADAKGGGNAQQVWQNQDVQDIKHNML